LRSSAAATRSSASAIAATIASRAAWAAGPSPRRPPSAALSMGGLVVEGERAAGERVV